ncbi:MAG: hypothetical protein KDD76_04055, partial [Rickettsiales bacterium]|nr:hypothetical protein [Rickettsiales bacterium]
YASLVLDDDVWISSERDKFDYTISKTSILIAKALAAGYPKDFLPPKILSCSSKGTKGFEGPFVSEDVPFPDRPQIIKIRSTAISAKPSGTDVADALRPILMNINPGIGDKTR